MNVNKGLEKCGHLLLAWPVATLLVTGACGFTKAKGAAESYADTYFRLAASNDPALFTLYDDGFFASTPRERWPSMYANLHTRVGNPRGHALKSWTVTNTAGTWGSGQYVVLVYDVVYERGSGQERIGIFIRSGSQKPGIRGQYFSGPELAQ